METSHTQDLRVALKDASEALGKDLRAVEDNLQERYESARDTVEKVVVGVALTTQNLSPAHQVRQHPWWWVGGAVVGGFLIGHGRGRTRSSTGEMVTAFRESVPPLGRAVQALAKDFQPEWEIVKNLGLTMVTQFLAEKLRRVSPEYETPINQFEQHLVSRYSNI